MFGTGLLKEHFCKRFVLEKRRFFILFNSADDALIVPKDGNWSWTSGRTNGYCKILYFYEGWSDRTIQKIHNWSFSVGKLWENHIDALDIREPILTPSPSKAVCQKLAREKLFAIDTQKWHSQLLSDGNGIDNGSKLQTDKKYKNSLTTKPYVTMNMRRDHRPPYSCQIQKL